MALIVQKYGGTSVGDAQRIQNVARRALKTQSDGNDVIVVVSAMSGQTDKLIALAHEITPNPDRRELDMMVSTGEQVSIALLAMAIQSQGGKAVSFNGYQVGIRTTNDFSRAKILGIDAEKIQNALYDGNIVVIAGFQGVDQHANITTLGRGGSDTTAVAIAAVVKADRCDIYTDVDGVYTTDPRIVPHARKLPLVTHDEMLELASLGAKVLHDRSVIFAMNYNVPLRVLSSLEEETPSSGTLIVKEKINMEDLVITGIAKKVNETRVNIADIPDRPGIAADIFKELADQNININLIVQSIGVEGKSQISFTVLTADLDATRKIMDKVSLHFEGTTVTYDDDIAIISVVGVGMKAHSGVASAVFDVLAKNKINIEMISTSEIKISVVIDKELADQTVKLLHARFFEK